MAPLEAQSSGVNQRVISDDRLFYTYERMKEISGQVLVIIIIICLLRSAN